MKKLLLLTSLFPAMAWSQPHVKNDTGRIKPETYIDMFKDAAIVDMQKTGVPASITLAQGMFESDYGNSDLAVKANNHFGIKCHKEWNGETFHKDDDAPNECFRKYNSVLESYDDHSNFLKSRERYQSLFELDKTDYKSWAHGLKKAGYATNPQYASRLIEIIERYKLYELDQQVLASNGNITPSVTPKPANRRSHDNQSSAAAEDANTVNGVPFVIARKGDTWTRIARENNLDLWQVLDYNDVDKNEVLREGDKVFVKPKKKRAMEYTHVVAEGESMRAISQQYGIRLKRLYQMNELSYGTQPAPGTAIYLRRAMLFGIVL